MTDKRHETDEEKQNARTKRADVILTVSLGFILIGALLVILM